MGEKNLKIDNAIVEMANGTRPMTGKIADYVNMVEAVTPKRLEEIATGNFDIKLWNRMFGINVDIKGELMTAAKIVQERRKTRAAVEEQLPPSA